MTTTYNRTLFLEDLTKATVILHIFENSKYSEDRGEEHKVEYTGVKSWSIVDGEDAAQIEAESDGSCIDELHEYLVLSFANGDTATFRNNHVAMFIW